MFVYINVSQSIHVSAVQFCGLDFVGLEGFTEQDSNQIILCSYFARCKYQLRAEWYNHLITTFNHEIT